jgi:hypothetical protein
MASDEQRLERIRRTWHAARVDDGEVAAAYSRYRARRAASERHPSFVDFGIGFAVAALALLVLRVGGVLGDRTDPRSAELAPTAATFASAAYQAGEAATGAAAALASAPPSAVAAVIERAGETVPVEPFVPYLVAEGERVVVRLGHEVLTIDGPRVLEFRLDPERASGWRMHQVESAAASATAGAAMPRAFPGREAPGPLPGGEDSRRGVGVEVGVAPPTRQVVEEQAQSSWTRAAEALRNGDTAQAETALIELSNTESVGTRDSARLTLAQVYLSQGREAEARALLTRLSEGGATPFVRRRASELLGR